MITTTLSSTFTNPTGKYLYLPGNVKASLGLEEDIELFVYSNSSTKELYFCVVPLDRPISAMTIMGADEPGLVATIATTFGKHNENITHFASFAFGGSSVTEVIFQHLNPVKKVGEFTKICKDIVEELEKYKRIISDVNEQRLYYIIPRPPLPKRRLRPVKVTTKQLNIPLPPLLLDQLGFKTEEEKNRQYFVLLTAYVRFPILVARFFQNPDQIVEISIRVAHKPNVLGPICDSLKKSLNVFSVMLKYLGTQRSVEPVQYVRLILYGTLLGRRTKVDIQNALQPFLEKGIVDKDRLICRIISERES